MHHFAFGLIFYFFFFLCVNQQGEDEKPWALGLMGSLVHPGYALEFCVDNQSSACIVKIPCALIG